MLDWISVVVLEFVWVIRICFMFMMLNCSFVVIRWLMCLEVVISILFFMWLYFFVMDVWFFMWILVVFFFMNILVSFMVVVVLLNFVLVLVMMGGSMFMYGVCSFCFLVMFRCVLCCLWLWNCCVMNRCFILLGIVFMG